MRKGRGTRQHSYQGETVRCLSQSPVTTALLMLVPSAMVMVMVMAARPLPRMFQAALPLDPPLHPLVP